MLTCRKVYHPETNSSTASIPLPSQCSCQTSFKTERLASRLRLDHPNKKHPGGSALKYSLLLLITLLFSPSVLLAQTSTAETPAAKIIQPSHPTTVSTTAQPAELRIPAGTPIEVEVAYTVNSFDMKPGERISFRVLIPIVVDGVALIEKEALVTARITQAKRGGHWGKGGKLTWSMEDVVAIDNSRVPLALESASRDEVLWSLENKSPKRNEAVKGLGTVKGTSRSGEVATRAVLSGLLFPPLGLLHGFKRGDNAVLREGRRFVVMVGRDTTVKTAAAVVAR